MRTPLVLPEVPAMVCSDHYWEILVLRVAEFLVERYSLVVFLDQKVVASLLELTR